MYRLGYLELIQYQEILAYPILLLIVMVSVVVCNIYARKSLDNIVKDFRDEKLDGLEIKISKLKNSTIHLYPFRVMPIHISGTIICAI